MIGGLFFIGKDTKMTIISDGDQEQREKGDKRASQSHDTLNELINAEARREALEGEFVFSSSSVEELMRFLNSD